MGMVRVLVSGIRTLAISRVLDMRASLAFSNTLIRWPRSYTLAYVRRDAIRFLLQSFRVLLAMQPLESTLLFPFLLDASLLDTRRRTIDAVA